MEDIILSGLLQILEFERELSTTPIQMHQLLLYRQHLLQKVAIQDCY